MPTKRDDAERPSGTTARKNPRDPEKASAAADEVVPAEATERKPEGPRFWTVATRRGPP